MLHPQSPIGKFITFTYKEPDFIVDRSLREKLENIVDLIKIKTQTWGMEHTSQYLQNELFDVRMELLRYLIENPEKLKVYESKILDEIASKYYLAGKHKKLGQIVADSLEVYFKVFLQISDNLIKSISNNSLGNQEIPTLKGLENLLLIQPSKEVENYVECLKASLNFDYALIVSDFIFKDELLFKTAKINELINFIKLTIEDFGSYSIVTNYWEPDNDDESQLIRNIKIKAAILEVENGRTVSYSNEQFYQLIST